MCALGSMCEGETRPLRSSSQETVTQCVTHSRETLPVVVSSWGLEEGTRHLSLIRLHMVILPTLLARLVVRLISNPVGILSLILGIAVPPVRGWCVRGGGREVELTSTIILYNLVCIIFSFPPSIQASLLLPFPHVPSFQ